MDNLELLNGNKFYIDRRFYIPLAVCENKDGDELITLYQESNERNVILKKESELPAPYKKVIRTLHYGDFYKDNDHSMMVYSDSKEIDEGLGQRPVLTTTGEIVNAGKTYTYDGYVIKVRNNGHLTFISKSDDGIDYSVRELVLTVTPLTEVEPGTSPFTGEKIENPVEVAVTPWDKITLDVSEVPSDFLLSTESGIYFNREMSYCIDWFEENVVSEYDVINGLTDDYFVCAECGEVKLCEESMDVDDELICDSCIDEEYVWCEHEEVYTRYDNSICAANGEYYTENFADNHMSSCTGCGQYFMWDDMVVARDTGDMYCHECAKDDLYQDSDGYWYESIEETGVIKDYNYKPEPTFHGTGEKFIGMEWEVDRVNVGNKYEDADEVFGGGDLWYCKYDGSLDYGFEAVSHPATPEYWMEEVPFDWYCRELWDRDYEERSTAGIHFHVNRSFFKSNRCIGHLIRFFEENYGSIYRFAERIGDSNHFCAKYSFSDSFLEENNDEDLYLAARDDYERYRAVNVRNSNTIEFRIFQSVLRSDVIRSFIQFIDVITDLANDIRYRIDWINIEKLATEKGYDELLERMWR